MCVPSGDQPGRIPPIGVVAVSTVTRPLSRSIVAMRRRPQVPVRIGRFPDEDDAAAHHARRPVGNPAGTTAASPATEPHIRCRPPAAGRRPARRARASRRPCTAGGTRPVTRRAGPAGRCHRGRARARPSRPNRRSTPVRPRMTDPRRSGSPSASRPARRYAMRSPGRAFAVGDGVTDDDGVGPGVASSASDGVGGTTSVKRTQPAAGSQRPAHEQECGGGKERECHDDAAADAAAPGPTTGISARLSRRSDGAVSTSPTSASYQARSRSSRSRSVIGRSSGCRRARWRRAAVARRSGVATGPSRSGCRVDWRCRRRSGRGRTAARRRPGGRATARRWRPR